MITYDYEAFKIMFVNFLFSDLGIMILWRKHTEEECHCI